MSKTNLKVLSILLFVICIFFHQVIIGEDLFLSSDALSAKTISHGIDLAEATYDEYPLWMPWIFSGIPSTHSMQNISEYYFPHYIISIIKATGIPWFWNFLLHFIFCGFGMYLFMKRLGSSHLGSLLSSISFMIIPYMVVMIVHGHGSQVMTAAYIPWIMWGIVKLEEELSLKNIGILGFLIGLQLQRAHVQIAYYTWMLMIAYLIFKFISEYKTMDNIRFYISWLVSSVLGFCMSLWIYIPLINYAGLSNRSMSDGGASFTYATSWSLHPFEALTMLLPFSFGFGESTYFGYMPFTNFPNYVSIVLVLLSTCAFYKNINNRLIFFFLFIFLFSLFISFGKYFPLYGLLYEWLPYFNKFRVPSMILILSQFSICVLASIGFDNLLLKIKSKDKMLSNILTCFSFAVLAISIVRYFFHDFSNHRIQHEIINAQRLSMIGGDVLTTAIILGLFVVILKLLSHHRISINKFAFLLTIIFILDIGRVNRRIINPPEGISNPVIKHEKYLNAQLNPDEIIEFFKKDTTKFRVLPLGDFADNRLVAFNIETISGYHPAKLASYENLMNRVGINENILKLLNVKYILSPQQLSSKQMADLSLLRVLSGKYYNNFQYKDAYVYKYMEFESRIQFARNLKSLDSEEEGYIILGKENFSLSNDSFVIDSDNKIIPEDFSFNEKSSLVIEGWSPNEIIIKADVIGDANHFILLSEAYFPYGWHMTGAADNDIIRVNNFIRGILVSPGENKITLNFQPRDIKYSSILTYFSFFLILILIFSNKIRSIRERI